MKTSLDLALAALREIIDIEKSANNGWNGLSNACSVARRALAHIDQQEGRALDQMVDADIAHQEELARDGMESL